jgi:hypothetical protein
MLFPPSQGFADSDLVVTQLPARRLAELERIHVTHEQHGPLTPWLLWPEFADGARLVKVYPDASTQILSQGFQSAADPEISFDASQLLFSAKRTADDDWNIYEMQTDGSGIRQVTHGIGNCRSPGYQATLYTIVSPKPWYQLTFVGSEKGALNESGDGIATSLYSCKLDGSAVRRLTFNLSSDRDPFIMPDGRLLFATWQRSRLNRGLLGRVSLFGINIDGADCAPFCTNEGKRIKHMPCTTTKGLALFVEADRLARDGSGTIGSVLLRRPLHSYRPITKESDGLFHSPSPLPDGTVLVSRRSPDNSDTFGVYRLDLSTRRTELIFDDPKYHDIQAKLVYPRPEPDGRSSVVTEADPNGKLYCLDVHLCDIDNPALTSPGTVKRLRILEGVPSAEDTPGPSPNGIPKLAQRRILGEIDIEQDGSFNVAIPANTAIELQTLDADGMALRSCGWIWAKNHEPRGCIGCHEDGELTPENSFVDAAKHPSIQLTLPVERRRTVDFRRDVMPIIAKKCTQCHDRTDAAVRLTRDFSPVVRSDGKAYFNRSYESLLAPGEQPGRGKYVHPGSARTSPLIWYLFGRNTSRPWDAAFSQKEVPRMPPKPYAALTDDQKRTFVEWIDMGALWDGIPGADDLPGFRQDNKGGDR